MRTTLRCVGALGVALLCVALVGACGGDDDSAQSLPAADDAGGDDSGGDDRDDGGGEDSGDDNGGGDNGGGGAPGIPGGNSGGGARGAPIDIPAIQQKGLPIRVVRPILEEEIRAACRDAGYQDLCLVVEVKDGEENCSFVGTDPPGGTSVDRDETKTVVVLASCESGSGGETDGDGETETDGDGETETDGDGETETDGDGETDGNGETDIAPESDSEGTP